MPVERTAMKNRPSNRGSRARRARSQTLASSAATGPAYPSSSFSESPFSDVNGSAREDLPFRGGVDRDRHDQREHGDRNGDQNDQGTIRLHAVFFDRAVDDVVAPAGQDRQ